MLGLSLSPPPPQHAQPTSPARIGRPLESSKDADRNPHHRPSSGTVHIRIIHAPRLLTQYITWDPDYYSRKSQQATPSLPLFNRPTACKNLDVEDGPGGAPFVVKGAFGFVTRGAVFGLVGGRGGACAACNASRWLFWLVDRSVAWLCLFAVVLLETECLLWYCLRPHTWCLPTTRLSVAGSGFAVALASSRGPDEGARSSSIGTSTAPSACASRGRVCVRSSPAASHPSLSSSG